MSPLVITVLRLAYLGLLWLLVLAVVRVVRRDVFGTTIKEKRNRSLDPLTPREVHRVGGKNKQVTVPSGTYLRLLVSSGPLAGASLDITGGTVTFGRAPNCSLVLDDEYASSMHAKLYEKNGEYWLTDMQSTNGTYLDNKPVEGEVRVHVGQAIKIGETVIELVR